MSLHVQKYIGCFLPNNYIKYVFDDRILKIQEMFDSDEMEDVRFVDSMCERLKPFVFENPSKAKTFAFVNELRVNGKLDVEKMIRFVDYGDDFEGILFQSPIDRGYDRRGDLIDYFETLHNPGFYIRYLEEPIRPLQSYMYNLTEARFKQVFSLYGHDIDDALHELKQHAYGDILDFEYLYGRIDVNLIAKLVERKFLLPAVDDMFFQLALATGYTHKGVDYSEFVSLVRPAIITTWT